jgi:hypothetical protein
MKRQAQRQAQTKLEVLDDLDFTNPFHRVLATTIDSALWNCRMIMGIVAITGKKRLELRKDNVKVTIESYE